jgi:hypothetical protein
LFLLLLVLQLFVIIPNIIFDEYSLIFSNKVAKLVLLFAETCFLSFLIYMKRSSILANLSSLFPGKFSAASGGID